MSTFPVCRQSARAIAYEKAIGVNGVDFLQSKWTRHPPPHPRAATGSETEGQQQALLFINDVK